MPDSHFSHFSRNSKGIVELPPQAPLKPPAIIAMMPTITSALAM
jgi:hypothetical protein